jgi:hypothetical protein
MEGIQTIQKKTVSTVLVVVAFIGVLSLVYGIYKMYFRFNTQDVKDYIREAALKYKESDRLAAELIIKDGVKEILNSTYRSNQIKRIARLNGTPAELELVNAAVLDAQFYNALA